MQPNSSFKSLALATDSPNLLSSLGFFVLKCLQQTLNYLCFLIVFYAVVKVLASLQRPAIYDVKRSTSRGSSHP